MNKLSTSELHLLRLTKSGVQPDGWTPVSPAVLPLVKKLPVSLITVEDTENERGRAKLTPEGETVVTWS